MASHPPLCTGLSEAVSRRGRSDLSHAAPHSLSPSGFGQRSMAAMFPSSWRSPAAGVRLLSSRDDDEKRERGVGSQAGCHLTVPGPAVMHVVSRDVIGTLSQIRVIFFRAGVTRRWSHIAPAHERAGLLEPVASRDRWVRGRSLGRTESSMTFGRHRPPRENHSAGMG